MSNYAASGNPPNGSRNISEVVRKEFKLIESAISSKAEVGGLSGTSITSLTIGTGIKVLTIQPNKDLIIGMSVFIADSANPANNMLGLITQYTASTGLLRVNVTSVGGSGTKTSWIVGMSSPAGVTLGNNTFTGFQNYAQATVVSSATTSDIWTAGGNQVIFTGTATVTAFPPAPQPGADRQLICTGACSFTSSANLLIAGTPIGNTYVAHANDVINVYALSVSQFLLTLERYDGKPNLIIPNTKLDVMNGTPGVGSVNTRIRRFLTVNANTGEGTDWTFAQSSTLGDSITILRSGVYSVYYLEFQQSSNGHFGISINSNQLSTSIASINTDHIFSSMSSSTTNYSSVCQSRTAYIAASSVLRAHVGSSTFNNDNVYNRLIVERIS